jgi:NAD+ synthase (glutamine-hydrolysing)
MYSDNLTKELKKIKVGVCTINQWVLDFSKNQENIMKVISSCIEQNVKLVVFPELVVCGYSCEDHFYERELYSYSFDIIKEIIKKSREVDMIISLGCPIIHNDVKYNTNIFIYGGKIVLIRPKTILADDGNYREARWFTVWPKDKYEEFVYELYGKKEKCPIGIASINYDGVLIAGEICEELWAPESMNTGLYLSGVDIIINPSGSYFEAGKLEKRINLIKHATKKNGGVYLYSNLEGGDGQRIYFGGGSIIAQNGEIINIEDRFDMLDIKLMVEDIDLYSTISNRMRNNSYETHASKQKLFPVIDIEKIESQLNLDDTFGFGGNKKGGTKFKESNNKNKDVNMDIASIVDVASCWLWDYLRRSGATGFVLPLSGGADSAVTGTIVYNMCKLMVESYNKESNSISNKNVLNYINKIINTDLLSYEIKSDILKFSKFLFIFSSKIELYFPSFLGI